MDIAKEIATRAADIEQRIQTYLPKVEGYQHTIFEAMAYSVTAGQAASSDADGSFL